MFDFSRHQLGLEESLAAVHDAVADRLDYTYAAINLDQHLVHPLHRLTVITCHHTPPLFLVAARQHQLRSLFADALKQTAQA